MKVFLLSVFLLMVACVNAQTVAKVPDSVRRIVDEQNGVSQYNQVSSSSMGNTRSALDSDQVIKDRLVKLAYKNDEIIAGNANVEIAEINRKKANSSLLSSLNIGANANEFVINNSAQASFFPKYNIGLSIPLDIFARSKAEKRVADQNIVYNKAQVELVKKRLKANVLVLYATYKEKKRQLELQKIVYDEDASMYENAQKDFKEQTITLEQLNKIYRGIILERAILAEKEKDLDIATIQLEELIGVPLQTVLGR